jgi:hypothetical protein
MFWFIMQLESAPWLAITLFVFVFVFDILEPTLTITFIRWLGDYEVAIIDYDPKFNMTDQ